MAAHPPAAGSPPPPPPPPAPWPPAKDPSEAQRNAAPSPASFPAPLGLPPMARAFRGCVLLPLLKWVRSGAADLVRGPTPRDETTGGNGVRVIGSPRPGPGRFDTEAPAQLAKGFHALSTEGVVMFVLTGPPVSFDVCTL